MACYLVTARAKTADLSALRRRIEAGEIRTMRPPLAQGQAAVLDEYFADITVEPVREGCMWARIDALPRLWPR